MTLPFPKSGAHTSHLSACSQPAVCPEPKFPQNSHVSHIWHHLGIFREGCVWLEAFLARVRHVNSLSHYVSTLAITRDSFFLSFRTTSQYMWSQFWPLMFRVGYGVHYWPIERTKRHWPRSSHAGQGVEANVWYCLLLHTFAFPSLQTIYVAIFLGGLSIIKRVKSGHICLWSVCLKSFSAADHLWII